MHDEEKSKTQLIEELAALRQRVSELEHRQAETFWQNGEHFRLIFEQAPVGMCILDLESRITKVNKAMCDMLGYTEAEMLGMTGNEITHPDDIEISTTRIQRQIANRTLQTMRVQKRYIRKDQKVIWATLTAILIRNENGEALYGVAMIEDISKRKMAEKSLQDSEARFRAVFEQGPLGMTIVAAPDNLIAVNHVLCDMLGYTEAELRTFPAVDITHPEDVQAAKQLTEQIMRGEISAYKIEKRYIKKSGEVIWTSVTASTIRDEHGQVAYIIGMIEDITERRIAEQTLRESENRFRTVFERSPLGMSFTDRDGYFARVNSTLCEIVGYSEVELKKRTFRDITYPDDQEADWELAEKTIAGELPFVKIEKRYVKKSGEVIWVMVTGAVVRDERGQFLYGIGMTEDITHRKRIEESLRKSEEKWRTLVENAPDIILMLDQEGTILFINQSLRDLASDELLGARVHDFLAPEYRDISMANIQKVFETGIPISYEVSGMDVDGVVRWYRSRLGAVKLDEETTAVMGIATDITEQKETEQALARYAQRFRTLHEIDRAILEAKSPEEITQAALRRIRELLPCQRASVTLFDFETYEGVILGVDVNGESHLNKGSRQPITDLNNGIDLLFEAFHRDKIRVVGDILKLENRSASDEIVLSEGIRSYMSLPMFSRGDLIGALTIGSAVPNIFREEHFEIAREVADQLAVAIQQSRLHNEVENARERLQALSLRLVEVQESERHHLARELHDEIGQILTGLKLTLEMNKTLPPEPQREGMDEAQKLVNDLLTRVRELSLNLRPAMLDDLGLLPTLLWHFGRYTAHTGIKVNFRHSSLDQRFRPEIEITAYRLIQEALTNAARYGEVSEVMVRLWTDQDKMSIQVEDNGIGFDVEVALSSRTSFGLVGMQERAFGLGGEVVIESKPGEGTRLIAELPLNGENHL